MAIVNSYFAALDEREQARNSFPGLIGTEQFHRSELHGYEVDTDGDLVIPELSHAVYHAPFEMGAQSDAEIRAQLRRICVERSPDSIDRFFCAQKGMR